MLILNQLTFSSVHGIWKPCAGLLTPWNTHLGSEETDPDARAHEANPKTSSVTKYMQNYYNDPTIVGNPYYYGHVPEVTVNANGDTSVVKHYSMGRMAFERVKVMPDNRTVIYGIDSNPGGFFMYVADKEKKIYQPVRYMLQSGFRLVQTMAARQILNGLSLVMQQMQKFKKMADTLKFSDIFDVTDDAVKGQAEGYTPVKTPANGKKSGMVESEAGNGKKSGCFLRNTPLCGLRWCNSRI
ncbi:hypothetical protein GCM10020331_102100 [Ectobacillus funiculus]